MAVTEFAHVAAFEHLTYEVCLLAADVRDGYAEPAVLEQAAELIDCVADWIHAHASRKA